MDGQLGNQGSISGRGTYPSLLCPDQLWAALPCLLSNGFWQLFQQEVKCPGHETGQSFPSSIESKNVWGYTSIYSHTCI